MGSWHKLTLLRKAAICTSIALAFATLVADATVLSSLNKYSIHGSPLRGASGWTMFVTVISLIFLPLLLTRLEQIQRWVNRTGVELVILSVFTLFYFISGIVLASKSSNKYCFTSTLCHRVRAATAFCWLAFFALVVAMSVVGLIARTQSKLGLPLFTAYSFDIEGQDITPAPVASHDMHAAALSLGGTHFSGNNVASQSAIGTGEKHAYPSEYEYGSAYMSNN
ncbi:hypothetical protein EV180_001108 [Coemansia sp. RSA 518]|nr:hypothetical protein EV181_004970 [Coemansia sp. RSA 532]KAJ2224415.1 hypothetical protein IW143_000568 [Coemansia sp. RSA 520]KAJ2230203.1 hypothetical protein EV180_001108 [Coemansia sp. RSA 518]KAJ2251033.1 hypothetical protein GGH97_000260 [Coemansia sp. RSA 475]KAJ2291348.1 hypothetical protein IW141_002713 [Coemansia sp. RSA 355]KAJ2435608.1 hypothetical protein IWW41_000780 [Coemansia sp. RSA 2522]KAJ2720552.1 hypothetical protein H4S00_003193 [Coemansia sp. D1744]